jgi:hypothetical protein
LSLGRTLEKSTGYNVFHRHQHRNADTALTGLDRDLKARKGDHLLKHSGTLAGVLFIIFGVLVLVFDDLLKWLVGIFFIVAGILTLIRTSEDRHHPS